MLKKEGILSINSQKFKVKEYKEDKQKDDGRVIWTTDKVYKLLDAMEEGYQASDHPFYEGDPN